MTHIRALHLIVFWHSGILPRLKEHMHHPLLVIAVFVVRFLAIHPFQDGNGRLSRALTTLLLLQNGYTYVIYSSLERVIEMHKEHYYRTLYQAQSTLDTGNTKLIAWARSWRLVRACLTAITLRTFEHRPHQRSRTRMNVDQWVA